MPTLSDRKAAAIHQHVTQLHQMQEVARTNLCKLRQHLVKCGHLTSDTQHLLINVACDVGGGMKIPSALSKLFPPSFRTSRRSVELAATVFNTTELLENILVNLGVRDVLSAMQVSHRFQSVIEGSPVIQRKMGLKADPDRALRFPLASETRYLLCSTDASTWSMRTAPNDKILVKVDCARATSTTAKLNLGARCRSLLICQPPLKTLKVYVSCCHSIYRHTSRAPAEVLTSETGITFGDIVDTANRVKEAHVLCPRAETFMHDEQGYVHADVRFEAEIEVPAHEPLLLAKRRWMQREREQQLKGAAKQARMAPYVAAKRLGKWNAVCLSVKVMC